VGFVCISFPGHFSIDPSIRTNEVTMRFNVRFLLLYAMPYVALCAALWKVNNELVNGQAFPLFLAALIGYGYFLRSRRREIERD
jgi:hypothetical protein